ncbi:MAG: tetratricopeptide repeat protein [Candidatus Latescibacteria bacterium]|nr:tetratricopeptide repeat protein [Candidatus Latescibacterota bacterium]
MDVKYTDLLCLAIILFGSTLTNGQATRPVAEIFEEAQRLHLGLDQPPDYRSAFARYQEVISRDTRHKDAYYNMAHICFAQKRYDLAAKYYQQVLRIDSEDIDARNNLGTVFFSQGNLKRAKTEYLKVIRLDRDHGKAYYNLAVVYLQEDDKERAEKAIAEALRSEPENPDYVRLQAELQGDTGPVSAGTALAVVSGFAGIVVGYYFLFGRTGV